ncbi:MAG: hypothetical protein JSW72_08515 [Candidatus Bathyarchaeota archaeon]|nr:MAG: hypothetical protein JSW72_08515 [Candidatus Bathyarchaeota archaeon]
MRGRQIIGMTLILMMLLTLNIDAAEPIQLVEEKEAVTKKFEAAETAVAKDVLIISYPQRYAYFGWFRASQMPSTGWELLNRTILWAAGYLLPNETRIVFFARMQPADDSAVVYGWLVGSGYDALNIDVRNHSDAEGLPSEYYDDFDLVIYWNTTGYDSINIIDSEIPFLTVSAAQTDEMGLGSGIVTTQAHNDTFYVVNNNYYPTHGHPLCSLTFESEMAFEATAAAGRGEVLVRAEVQIVEPQVEISRKQDIAVALDGSASMAFTFTIPESSLADLYRQSFFENASALETGVEYEVPETKTLHATLELEEEVEDTTLPGDIDADGKTDIKDVAKTAICFGLLLGDDGWDFDADINWDGKIDIKDIAIVAKNFGKTRENTGHLNVACYYNGTGVSCANLYYVGPGGASPPINTSGVYTWFGLYPGLYTVYGTHNMTQRSTAVNITAQETSYAQLDFGGIERPPMQQPVIPVREQFHLGVMIEQLVLLGFVVDVTESKIVPWGTGNVTMVSVNAYSPLVAEFISFWRINVGPQDENATDMASDLMFTDLQFKQMFLRKLAGDQVFQSTWQIVFELPSTASIINAGELVGLNWTVDFGGGTYMEANVTLDTILPRVIVTETMVVTEQNITASEAYLAEAYTQYRIFKIDYFLSSLPSNAANTGANDSCIYEDWSEKWRWPISPGTFRKRWTRGPLTANLRVRPELLVEWKIGWRFKWGGILNPLSFKLKKFYTWIKINPWIEAKADATITEHSREPLLEYPIGEWKIAGFVFWVTCIPVTATLKLFVMARLTLELDVEMWLELTGRAEAEFKVGVKWEKGDGWSLIWEPEAGYHFGSAFRGGAEFTITPSVACRLALLLYGVAGPFIEAELAVPITIRWGEPNFVRFKVILRINYGIMFVDWLRDYIGLRTHIKTLEDWTLFTYQEP